MWPLWLAKMSSQHIQKNFPGLLLLYTPAKYEKNLPYRCEAIVKRKCKSGGVASLIHKQASLVERLKINIEFLKSIDFNRKGPELIIPLKWQFLHYLIKL